MRNATILTIASASLATAAIIPNNAAQTPTAVTTDAASTAFISQQTNYMPRDAKTALEEDIAALVDDNDEESENSRRLLAQANTDHKAKKLEARKSKKSKSRRQYGTKPGDCYIKDGHQECVVGAEPNYVGASGPQNSNSNNNSRHFDSEEDYHNFLSQTNGKEQVGDCFISSRGQELCVTGMSVSTNTNKPKPKGEFNIDPEYERQMAEYERKKEAQSYSVPYDHVWWGMSWEDACAVM